jgi:hypothetical protein
MVPNKVCAKCKEAKPPDQFHKNHKSPDKLNYYCKKCNALTCKAFRQESVVNITEARVVERFETKFKKADENICWPWLGGADNHGYGLFYVAGKTLLAARVSYALYAEPIPDGLVIRHKCDNPICVNPKHLETGTKNDNSKDMVYRNRSQKGEAHAQAKLSEKDVSEIRKLRISGMTCESISQLYGVSQSQISHITNRKSWKHIS